MQKQTKATEKESDERGLDQVKIYNMIEERIE
jgi:hypothetical protein